jgi:hypothetical protein
MVLHLGSRILRPKMTWRLRSTVAAAAVVAAASFVGIGPARSQVSCDSLPNPIVVTTSSDFEPTLGQFAARLAAESTPSTVITVAAGGQSTSCVAVGSVVSAKDFGGLTGRFYSQAAMGMIATKTCTFAAGQTAHVAISEVFYESCANVSQPKPADVIDALGPVQTMVFVVPIANDVTQYLTTEEARVIYGCGVSDARTVGKLSKPADVFCRDRASGVQITLARNLGISESTLGANCSWYANDGRLMFDMIPRPVPPCEPMTSRCEPPLAAIGLVSAGQFDLNRGTVNSIAFQADGQTKAFYPDSGPIVADRRNVRDGHYPLWGYVHLIAKTTEGKPSAQASELMAWIDGTKSTASIDHVMLEAGEGYIPQCAMRVKRSSDGGLLSPYTPLQPCPCAAEAFLSRSIPQGCVPCASASACTGGKSCRHGFCE